MNETLERKPSRPRAAGSAREQWRLTPKEVERFILSRSKTPKASRKFLHDIGVRFDRHGNISDVVSR